MIDADVEDHGCPWSDRPEALATSSFCELGIILYFGFAEVLCNHIASIDLMSLDTSEIPRRAKPPVPEMRNSCQKVWCKL